MNAARKSASPLSETVKLSRADQRERSRTVIMDTAIRMFAERGFAGVSLDELAAEAEVRRTLILYYFKSKEELWRSAARKVSAAFNAVLTEKIAHADRESDEERLHATLVASLDAYLEQPDFPRFLVREGGITSPRLRFLVDNFNYADVHYSDPQVEDLFGATILRDVLFAVFLAMAALGPLMEVSLSRVSGRAKSGVYPMTKRNRKMLIELLSGFMTTATLRPLPWL